MAEDHLLKCTSYFVSFEAARQFFAELGLSGRDVKHKLDAGKIHVGKPPHDEAQLVVKNGRYFIDDQI